MEFNLEIRKKQLQSLKQYVRSSEDNVKSVFQSLGWTIQKTLQKEDPKVICPLNKSHLISHKTAQEHLELCTLKSAGYEENESLLSEPSDKNDCSIKLTNAKKIEILSSAKGNKSEFKTAWNGRDLDPLTSDRLTSTFSIDERLALYDYSLKHTTAPPKPDEFTLDLSDPKEKKELSDKERLALERDAKRRRAKYKSVHTSKKNQTEVMKEVIDNQMALYTDWVKQKQEQEAKEKEKLKRLAKDKAKKKSSNDQNQLCGGQYQYIETTYDQNVVSQNPVQWDQSLPYSGSYDAQYFNSIQTTQGVITDWSHLYQGGIDTEFYTNSGQYQPEVGEHIEPSSSIDSAYPSAYTNNSQLSNLDPTTNNFYPNQSNAEKGENYKISSRLKETSRERSRYESDNREKNRTKEDTRQGKVRKSHHSREKRVDRKH